MEFKIRHFVISILLVGCGTIQQVPNHQNLKIGRNTQPETISFSKENSYSDVSVLIPSSVEANIEMGFFIGSTQN